MPRLPDLRGDHRYEERRRWFEHALRAGRDDPLPEQFARQVIAAEDSNGAEISRRTRANPARARSQTEAG